MSPKHLLPRLHGFELMMAPYSVAHMKLGLKLKETGYEFESEERLRVYLTNTLEEPQDFSGRLYADFLAHEAEAANRVKGDIPVTVVIGNPPYAERSQNNSDFIASLMEQYKTTIRHEEAQIKTVSNDYVKFLRYAHHRAISSGHALIGFITNNGFLDGRLFRDLRKVWLEDFDRIAVLNLHGSGRRGDVEGVDENVFDILQGVSISLLVHSSINHGTTSEVWFGEMFGTRLSKYARLDRSNHMRLCSMKLHPRQPLYLFAPETHNTATCETWALPAIFGTGNPRQDRNVTYAGGFKTRQDRFTVALDERNLRERITELADALNSEEQLRTKYKLCTTSHFDFDRARRAAQSGALSDNIRFARYRPFDDRPMIWAREVLCEPQVEVSQHLLQPNLCLVTSRVVKDAEFRHVSVSRGPVEVISLSNSTSTNAYMFPLYRYPDSSLLSSYEFGDLERTPNLSESFVRALRTKLGFDTQGDVWAAQDELITPEDIFAYVYALLHAQGFRQYFGDQLLRDFPAIPLTSSVDLFRMLVALGNDLVALHLLESDFPAASWNNSMSTGKNPLKEESTNFTGESRTQIAAGYPKFEHDKVYVNPSHYFSGVPEQVWEYRVGKYQVCDKWLKDRRGRSLTSEDILHYKQIVIALRETLRLRTKIDEVIELHGGWPLAGSLKDVEEGGTEVIHLTIRVVVR